MPASKYTKTPGVVIPQLDRGIQSFQQVLDCPVKPDNDDIEVSNCRVNNSIETTFSSGGSDPGFLPLFVTFQFLQ